MLEKTFEGPLDCKEIQQVNPKGNQSWIFIGRTDAEAETPILWPPDAKNWLIGKDPDAGRDWSQEKKGMTEDEMVGWHHQLGGHEFEQALGVGDRQGSLVCSSPRGRKASDTTEQLNLTELILRIGLIWWLSKESACKAGELSFDSWLGKIPWKRKWQPTPVFLPWKLHGQIPTIGLQDWLTLPLSS